LVAWRFQFIDLQTRVNVLSFQALMLGECALCLLVRVDIIVSESCCRLRRGIHTEISVIVQAFF
jgi:hypothetical protein